jgi:hypothetical protein
MNMAVMVDLMMKCGYVMILDQCLWPTCMLKVPLWTHHRMMNSGLVQTNMLLPPLTMSMKRFNDNSFRPTSTEVPRPMVIETEARFEGFAFWRVRFRAMA